MHRMGKPLTYACQSFARKVLARYWFEIVSGIFVGLSAALIFARKVPIS